MSGLGQVSGEVACPGGGGGGEWAWGGAVALLPGEPLHTPGGRALSEAASTPSLLSPAPTAAPPPALRLLLHPQAPLALSPPLAPTPALLTSPAPTRQLILTCCVLPLTPACPLPTRCSPTPAGRLLCPGPAGLRSGWWTPWGTPGLSLSTPGSSLHARYVPSGFCVGVGPPPRAPACLPCSPCTLPAGPPELSGGKPRAGGRWGGPGPSEPGGHRARAGLIPPHLPTPQHRDP